MSNLGLQMSPESDVPEGPRHRGRSWMAVLLSLAVIGVIALGAKTLLDRVDVFGGGPEDFSGEGGEPVQVRVEEGQTLAQIGQTLKEAEVVASVDAWVNATKSEPRSATISPALYNLRLQMSADAALQRMLDPSAKVVNQLLLREGLRIWETYDAITEATDIKQATLEKTAKSGKIGLPAYAKNDPEGFMFPATYQLDPKESARSILTRLTKRYNQAAEKVGLAEGAKKLGISEYEALIIASLIQAEGHPDDFAKISRVVHNRLNPDTWGDTYGLLQMDTALNYALKNKDLVLTNEQIENLDSPFNLYKHPGLPPTPVNSPGEDALDAAVHPADGDWLYYVTVNTDTGETKFTNSYEEFLKFKQEFSDFLDEKGR